MSTKQTRWALVAAISVCALIFLIKHPNFAGSMSLTSDEDGTRDSKILSHDAMKTGKSPRSTQESQYELSPEYRNLVDMGVFSDRNAADFYLIGMGEEIPDEALRAAGLDGEQRPELQRALSHLVEKMSRLTAARAVQDKEEAQKGNVVFDIPADPQGGADALFEFRQSLTASFGPKAADTLMHGLHCPQFFGSFGKQDVRMEVTEGTSHRGKPVYYVNYSCYDPATGKKYGGGRSNHESFGSRFGTGIVDKIFAAKETINQ